MALTRLASPDATERGAAIIDLGFHPFGQRALRAKRQIDQVFRRLARIARVDDDASVRTSATYVLSRWYELRAARALLEIFTDAGQAAEARGVAAEGLSLVLGACASRGSRGAPLVAAATRALREGLSDRAPDVRFWSIYALASLRVTDAREEIARLTDDDAICPNMGKISDEARDALRALDGEPSRVVSRGAT